MLNIRHPETISKRIKEETIQNTAEIVVVLFGVSKQTIKIPN